MTFWPLTNSDFPTNQTFHQLHDLYTEHDLHRIMRGFHGAFATGVASQQGTLTLPDTWFRPPFWDLLMLQLLRPNSSNLPCLYLTFHLEYPLVLSRFCSKKWHSYLIYGILKQSHMHIFSSICQIILEKIVGNGRKETETEGRTDGQTNEDLDSHYHTIIHPVLRQAYANGKKRRRKCWKKE